MTAPRAGLRPGTAPDHPLERHQALRSSTLGRPGAGAGRNGATLVVLAARDVTLSLFLRLFLSVRKGGCIFLRFRSTARFRRGSYAPFRAKCGRNASRERELRAFGVVAKRGRSCGASTVPGSTLAPLASALLAHKVSQTLVTCRTRRTGRSMFRMPNFRHMLSVPSVVLWLRVCVRGARNGNVVEGRQLALKTEHAKLLSAVVTFLVPILYAEKLRQTKRQEALV